MTINLLNINKSTHGVVITKKEMNKILFGMNFEELVNIEPYLDNQ